MSAAKNPGCRHPAVDWVIRAANCKHRRITLVGSDETGLLSIWCADCGARMSRRAVNGEYEYHRADDARGSKQRQEVKQ